MNMHLNTTFLQKIFEQEANKTLVHDLQRNCTFTYTDIYKLSRQFETFLKTKKNLDKGDFVAIVLDNRIETYLTYFACLFSGMVAVPINPQLSKSDIDQILHLANAKLVVSSKTIDEDVLGNYTKDKLLFDDHIHFDDLHQYSPETIIHDQDNHLIEVMFTSGTTGTPKAVPIVLNKILGNGRAFIDFHNVPENSTFYNILPSCYLGGWYNLFLIPILAKSTIVLDEPFGPTNMFRFWETVDTYNISVLWFSPTILSMLLAIGADEKVEERAKQITHTFVGMAPLSANLKQDFEKTFALTLYENFALSETFFLTSESKDSPRKTGSSGQILPGIKIHIDKNIGNEGEVLIQSPFMIEGYYTPNGIQKTTNDDGFFPTGDLGYIDDDGHLFITGRLKDIIIRGGINISPADIENTMRVLDGVQEVSVFGMPDDVYGEQVAIAIQKKPSSTLNEEGVQTFCEENLAAIKQPKEIFFVNEIPKNASGKIQKKELKKNLLNH